MQNSVRFCCSSSFAPSPQWSRLSLCGQREPFNRSRTGILIQSISAPKPARAILLVFTPCTSRYFGDDVPVIELMRTWVAKCGSAFTIVQRVVEDSGLPTRQELVGSFKLLPLTAKGVRAIELGQATGSTFRSEHISGGRSHPVGYYVGDVVATTRFARGSLWPNSTRRSRLRFEAR